MAHILHQSSVKMKGMRKEFAGLVMEHWEALDAGMADYEAARQEAIKKAPEDWKESVDRFFQDWYRYLTPIPKPGSWFGN